MAENLSAVEVLWIDEDHPVNGVNVTDVIDEISSTEVNGDLPIGWAFLEDPVERIFMK